MASACADCGRAFTMGGHKSVESVTRRRICADCDAAISAAAAGVLASPAQPVDGAIAT